jgi:predicted small lipoprotein YifL
MKNMLRTAALIALVSALVAGCGKTEDGKLNKRTPEQQQQADKLYDMGKPTDRSKSKGY